MQIIKPNFNKKILEENLGMFSYEIAVDNGFESYFDDSKIGIFTDINDNMYNCIYLKKIDTDFIDKLNKKNLSYEIIVPDEIQQDFDLEYSKSELRKFSNIEAHILDNIQDINLNPRSDIIMKQVKNLDDLRIFDYISSQSFNNKLGHTYYYLKNTLKNPNFELFLGYEGSIPVSCCMIYYFKNFVSLYWACVIKDYRGKKYGQDMVIFRLRRALEKKYYSALSINLDTSASYYKKIGFKSYGKLNAYFLDK
jgi:hypothetical protein